jgi:hypothetical protein
MGHCRAGYLAFLVGVLELSAESLNCKIEKKKNNKNFQKEFISS